MKYFLTDDLKAGIVDAYTNGFKHELTSIKAPDAPANIAYTNINTYRYKFVSVLLKVLYPYYVYNVVKIEQ